MPKYVIDTKHKHDEIVYYNADGIIRLTTIETAQALLNADGTFGVFYSVDTGKKKHGNALKDIIEECLLFKTPEEVANKILADFNKSKDEVKQENEK